MSAGGSIASTIITQLFPEPELVLNVADAPERVAETDLFSALAWSELAVKKFKEVAAEPPILPTPWAVVPICPSMAIMMSVGFAVLIDDTVGTELVPLLMNGRPAPVSNGVAVIIPNSPKA